MMKTAIVFDLDGTLLDTLPDLLGATNHILREAGYPVVSYSRLRGVVGNGAATQIRKCLPEGTPESEVERLLPLYKAWYADHCRLETAPYPGILQALQDLGDFPIAIVSNKPDTAVKALCADFFPGIYALGEIPGCPRKPAPDMVFQALRHLGADRCIYVGDSEVDVLTAKNTGCPCLSVAWGFRDRAVLEQSGATHICDRVSDLAPMLKAVAASL